MAWTDLKAAVAAVIKTNGNQEITGALLQSTLNSIIDQVGANATFKGVATPSTVPGTPDGPLFYIAYEKGIYANFNAINITEEDGLVIILYSSNWGKINIPLASKDELVQIETNLKLNINRDYSELQLLKDDLFYPNKNLFNHIKLQYGINWLSNSLNPNLNGDYCITDYMPVEQGKSYTLATQAADGIIQTYIKEFDKDLNPILRSSLIAFESPTSGKYIVASDVYFVKAFFRKTLYNASLKFGLYENRLTYSNFGDRSDFVKKEKVNISNYYPELKEELDIYWKSDNILDLNNLVIGYIFATSNGSLVSSTAWRTTNYLIPVIKGATIEVHKISDNVRVYFQLSEYDAEGVFIQRASDNNQTIYTVKNDVFFVKISMYSGWSGTDFQCYSYNYSRNTIFSNTYKPYGVLDSLKKGTKLNGKNVVYFGDSIIEFRAIHKYLKYITGANEVYNVGFGGCRLCQHGIGAGYDSFSMYRLADAITTNTYTYQDAGSTALGAAFGVGKQLSLDSLKSIDFNSIDIIIIHYCTNDWSSGVVNIGTGDKNDRYDFKGQIAYVIETILTAYPHIRIIFDTGLWRVSPLSDTNIDTSTNTKGNRLIDFNNAIKEVCVNYHLQSIDVFYGLFNQLNYTTYFSDTTHPNDKGIRLMAEIVANSL